MHGFRMGSAWVTRGQCECTGYVTCDAFFEHCTTLASFVIAVAAETPSPASELGGWLVAGSGTTPVAEEVGPGAAGGMPSLASLVILTKVRAACGRSSLFC